MPKPRLSAALRAWVYRRDNWHCRRCNRNSMLTPHHVTYQSQGGEHTANNLLTLCMVCHDLLHNGKIVIEVVKTVATDLIVKFWTRGDWDETRNR